MRGLKRRPEDCAHEAVGPSSIGPWCRDCGTRFFTAERTERGPGARRSWGFRAAVLAAAVLAAGWLSMTPAWLFATPADAGDDCGTYEDLVRRLTDAGFVPASVAISHGGAMVTVYRGEGDRWVMLVTSWWRESCVMARGHSWQELFRPGRSALEAPS